MGKYLTSKEPSRKANLKGKRFIPYEQKQEYQKSQLKIKLCTLFSFRDE